MSLVNRKPRKYKEPEQPEQRIMPVISPDRYLVPASANAITVEEKKAFLEHYYQSGNQSLSAKALGKPMAAFRYAMTVDKAFAEDFLNVKLAQKHNLEQTMYQNGLTPKGYMDRITWLRKNFPKEYNPNVVDKESPSSDAIKELSQKLGDYELIPKKKIIEGESSAVQERSATTIHEHDGSERKDEPGDGERVQPGERGDVPS